MCNAHVFYFFVLSYLDEVEIEKLEDAVAKAVRESNFSKAKEIQQKIDKIVMDKTATNQKSLQGEKNFRIYKSFVSYFNYLICITSSKF